MKLDKLLKKINYGYDGVLYEICFSNDLRNVKLTAFVQDEVGNRIVLIVFLNEIKECNVCQKNGNNFSWLSDGIKYKEIDGYHCITTTVNDEVDEIDTINIFKNTEVYFIVGKINYKIEPYDEKIWSVIFENNEYL